ncbi:MAG TPA: hypothetical protein VKR06_12765, partial [Ktedonosporobacter sp.]|nr:hypothetical protein [Ktedonosporobacter sp.]
VTFWVQSLDSCRQAIGGAYYELTGNGVDQVLGPTPGNKPVTISAAGPCPIPRGNCQVTSTGCLSFNLDVPASGTASYTITEIKAPKGFVACLKAVKCPVPAVVNVTVDSAGTVAATTSILFGDGKTVVFPKNMPLAPVPLPLANTNAVPSDLPPVGGAFTGTITDPAVVYNNQICVKQKGGKGKDECKGKGMVMRAITKVAVAAIKSSSVNAKQVAKPAAKPVHR